jgi:hypothetical protein
MENAASTGVAAVVNVASRNRLCAVDRQWNYVDHMSTVAQQQQRDCDCERHRQARGQQALHTTAYIPLTHSQLLKGPKCGPK